MVGVVVFCDNKDTQAGIGIMDFGIWDFGIWDFGVWLGLGVAISFFYIKCLISLALTLEDSNYFILTFVSTEHFPSTTRMFRYICKCLKLCEALTNVHTHLIVRT